MRTYATMNVIGQIPQPPDHVQTLLLAAAAGQSFDWPDSVGAAAANSSAAAAHLVRFTGMTSGGTVFGFMVNLVSTHAQVPTSGSSATTGTSVGSTGNSMPVLGERTFQIPTWSTGWSANALTSGYVMAEIWRK